MDPWGAAFVSPEEFALANLSDQRLGIWTASHFQNHSKNGISEKSAYQRIDLDHYNITATTKGKSLEATVKVRFQVLEEGFRVLPFNLFPHLRMNKVLDEQGHELSFIQEDKDEDGDFAVIFPTPLKKGATAQLVFEYGGDDAVSDSGGGNFTLLARDNWYPSSSNGQDYATYEMTLKCPKGLTMVATGQPGEETEENGMKISRWKSEVPLTVAGFNYGQFKKASATVPKTNFVVETFANKEIPDMFRRIQQNQQLAEVYGHRSETTLESLNTVGMMSQAMQEAQAASSIYNEAFGSLPYGRVAMTQQPFIGFGQAWPMLVYMPISAFLDSTYRNQLGLDGGNSDLFYRYVAAHEVSHQWWGHLLSWSSYRDQWLSEGFAHFSTSYFSQCVFKNDAFLKFWKDLRETLLAKTKDGLRPASAGAISLGYRLNSGKTGNVTQSVMYGKGAYVVHMLRMLMWDLQNHDAAFFNMMRDFVKTYAYQKVTTDDFKHMVEKHMTPTMDLMGDKTMNWFFDEFVNGNSIPDYKLDYRFEPLDGGKVMLIGNLIQSNVTDNFVMRIPVYFDFNGKIVRAFTQAVRGNTTAQEFKLTLPSKPTRIIVGAYEDVLCTTTNR